MLANLSRKVPAPDESWSSPPNDWVKINMDAAVGHNCIITTCVVWDNTSAILDWRYKVEPRCDPVTVEALAVDLAISSKWPAVIFVVMLRRCWMN